MKFFKLNVRRYYEEHFVKAMEILVTVKKKSVAKDTILKKKYLKSYLIESVRDQVINKYALDRLRQFKVLLKHEFMERSKQAELK